MKTEKPSLKKPVGPHSSHEVARGDKKTAFVLSDFGLKNFGNRLQSYAVLSLLKDFGITGFVAAPSNDAVLWRMKDVVKRFIPSRLWHKKRRYNRFRQFAKRYTPYLVVDIKRFYGLSERFDFVLVGSDQVWSPTYIARWSNPGMFFLMEVPREKKMAIAPSLGLTTIPSELETVYARGFKSFARLSVREEMGAQAIRRMCGLDAVVLADPTIGVKVEEWRSIANYSFCPNDEYILTYYLGGGIDGLTTLVADYARAHSLKIVNLMDEQGYYFDAGPAEFVGLIDRARYVVTDSFHGSVFSLLLHTPFSVVRRTDCVGREMYSRIETLAVKFNCWDRVLDDTDCTLDESVDWDGIDSLVAMERNKILSYLSEELSRCGLV